MTPLYEQLDVVVRHLPQGAPVGQVLRPIFEKERATNSVLDDAITSKETLEQLVAPVVERAKDLKRGTPMIAPALKPCLRNLLSRVYITTEESPGSPEWWRAPGSYRPPGWGIPIFLGTIGWVLGILIGTMAFFGVLVPRMIQIHQDRISEMPLWVWCICALFFWVAAVIGVRESEHNRVATSPLACAEELMRKAKWLDERIREAYPQQ